MLSDLAILAAADRIKLPLAGTVTAKLRLAIKAARANSVLVDGDSQLKAAVIATLRATSEPEDEDACAALLNELDVIFGATAARTGQPITLETALAALPNGKFPVGVLHIWLETLP